MNFRSAFVTAALLAANCIAQTPPNTQSPEAFIQTLIKAEAADSRAEENAQAGLRGAEKIYTPSLLALIRADRRRAHGEEGNLDYDPICSCQDTDGLMLKQLKIIFTSKTTADGLAILFEEEKVTYHLMLTPAGWRIDDISTSEVPSLRRLLK